MRAQQLNTSRTRLESYLDEMLAPLGRKDRRRWGQVYVRGLLLDGERKSVGAMVPRLPEGEEQALQQFVNSSIDLETRESFRNGRCRVWLRAPTDPAEE